MGKCTDAVTNWMIRCHVIHEEDKELYKACGGLVQPARKTIW